MFSEPSEGDRLQPRDIIGHLLVVRPLEYVRGIQTIHSRSAEGSDAVRIDVVNFDERDQYGQPVVYRGALWFQGKLIAALKSRIGETLLGRIQLEAAKPGMNAAFVFQSATQDTMAVAKAQAWLQQHPEFLAQQQPQDVPIQMPMPAAQPSLVQQQTVLEQLRRQAQQPQPGQWSPGTNNLEQSRVSQPGQAPF